MLLDEPLASLDPVIRRKLLGFFLSYAYDKDATILLSSHLVGDLERACDYIVLLSKGSVSLSQEAETLIGSHFWITNSNENQNLIRRLINPPSEYFIELDTQLLLCTQNRSLLDLLEAKPAGLEEIVIAKMSGSMVYPKASNLRRYK